MKKCYFLVLLACMQIANAMEQITSLQDAKKFAGHVVAYKAQSSYFTHGRTKKGNCINDDEQTYYGYVNKELDNWTSRKGYTLKRLIASEAIPSNCALTELDIKDSNLYMREATREEKDQIKEVITTDGAEFAYTDKELAYAMLTGTVKSYYEQKKQKTLAHARK